MKVSLAIVWSILLVGGCQGPEGEVVAPAENENPDTVLLGHVPGGLPEAFLEDASEHSRVALQRYIELSDAISAQGGEGASELRPWVSPEWWPSEQESFAFYEETGSRSLGSSQLSRFLVQSARFTPRGTVEVGVIACVDTTDVFVLPVELRDPPALLWEWHPDYEDFPGGPAEWADIEGFLSHPDVSWGSAEPVVFWFEGPDLASLLLTSSSPWWGVYSCASSS
jgi:hypothetical protein